VKLPVRCGVKDRGGKECRKPLGEIELPGSPGLAWVENGNYRLTWDQRFHDCPKHRTVEIHEYDVLQEALNDEVFDDGRSGRKRVLVALPPGTPRPAPR
jgi:hypothetical protein